MKNDLETFWAEVIAGGGICPQPQAWQHLWEMLPDKRQVGARWEPSLPLILDGWHYSNNLEKRARFREHFDWATFNGASDAAISYLRSLTPADWYTQ